MQLLIKLFGGFVDKIVKFLGKLNFVFRIFKKFFVALENSFIFLLKLFFKRSLALGIPVFESL